MAPKSISRRELLATGGVALGGLALGCSDDVSGPDGDAATDTGAAVDSGHDSGAGDGAVDASDATTDATTDADRDAGLVLATGGTDGFAGEYADPFDDTPGPTCALTCAQTLGPCYADVRLDRRDVTDGRVGWPTRLSFRLLEADGCTPLEDADVEIWHTDAEGNYSSVDNAACHPFEEGAPALTYMRGTQHSDARGRVDFDSVFPGWYPGRTPHIHMTIRTAAGELLTTQVYFRDALAAFAYREHLEYNHRPVQDTTNDDDGVARAIEIDDFIVQDRLVPGATGSALQCWFSFVLRSAVDDPLC